jgi:hypothetical protein
MRAAVLDPQNRIRRLRSTIMVIRRIMGVVAVGRLGLLGGMGRDSMLGVRAWSLVMRCRRRISRGMRIIRLVVGGMDSRHRRHRRVGMDLVGMIRVLRRRSSNRVDMGVDMISPRRMVDSSGVKVEGIRGGSKV